jgi:hypothetical protein
VNFDLGVLLIVALLGFFIFVVAMIFEWVAEKCITKWGRWERIGGVGGGRAVPAFEEDV